MRRSSSTTRRWGASSVSSAAAAASHFPSSTSPRDPHSRPPLAPRAVGAIDQPQHAVAMHRIEHGDQETPRHVAVLVPVSASARPMRAALQGREPQRQRFALGGDEQQPLAAIRGALLLFHIAFVDELLEHAAERLLGDVEDVEELRQLSFPDCG